MRKLLHIMVLLLAVAVVSCQGPRVIPRKDMVRVMREMLLQDQQIRINLTGRQADTLLVYEGIFEEYGYNTDDFRHSLNYYLAEPARMEKVMTEVAEGLEKESKGLREELELEKWQRDLMRIYGMPRDTTAPQPRVRPVDTLKVRFSEDSVYLHRELDSLDLIPRDSLLFVKK